MEVDGWTSQTADGRMNARRMDEQTDGRGMYEGWTEDGPDGQMDERVQKLIYEGH